MPKLNCPICRLVLFDEEVQVLRNTLEALKFAYTPDIIVGRDTKLIQWSPREYEFLTVMLATGIGRVATRGYIYDQIYLDGASEPNMWIIQNFAHKVRKKLAKRKSAWRLHTVLGRGYVLYSPDSWKRHQRQYVIKPLGMLGTSEFRA